ncbi:MAG TPA: hypothetical protein VK821_03535, partial [Dehalococcoidia bacterium]|nr:hypothetical protein [Dehalococcoidia bacterium]
MEQARRITIASVDATLEGILQTPSGVTPGGILVVCHPHPLYGGSMHNNVVDALCDAALQEGMSALRFNFRGVGASSGSHTGGDGEQDDVLAALTAAADLPGGAANESHSAGLAGYSFGASMAARVRSRASPAPRVLLLVSPPMSSLAVSLIGDDSDPGSLPHDGERGGPHLLLICGDR